MKKLLAAILALVMALSLCTAAWATEAGTTTYVAEVNGQKYETLQAAVNAAKDGETVTLLSNASGGVYFGYNADNTDWPKSVTKNITVDFSGNSYDAVPTVGSTNTKTNGFQLLKGNTVTLKNGTIQSTQAKILIQNYCNLTLEDMNLIGHGNTVVSINCGKVSIIGSTSITADGNNTALDVSWWPGAYADGGQAELNTTGTLTGNVTLGVFGNEVSGKNVPLTDEQKTDVKSNLKIVNANVVGSIKRLTAAGTTFDCGCTDEELDAIVEKMCTVTGGTFSTNPAAYVTDTKLAVTKGTDGKYTVSEAKVTDDNTAPEVVLPAASDGTATISKTDVDADKNLTITGEAAMVMFDQKAASVISAKATDGDLTLIAKDVTNAVDSLGEGIKTAYTVGMQGKASSSAKVMEFSLVMGVGGDSMFTSGKATITVPYKTNQKNVEVFYLQNGDTVKFTLASSLAALDVNQFYYNSTTGEVTMMLGHFSVYLIASDGQTSTGGGYYSYSPTIYAIKTAADAKSATDYSGGIYGLTFIYTVNYSSFTGVQVDGKTLAKSNYIAEANGSNTEIYLKAVYLQTLAAGKHTITGLSPAGNASTEFTIGGKTTAPQTFDAGIGVYAVTAVLSITGMAWTAKKRH